MIQIVRKEFYVMQKVGAVMIDDTFVLKWNQKLTSQIRKDGKRGCIEAGVHRMY